MRRRRSSLSLLPRLAIFIVLVGPTLVLALQAGGAFLNYADAMLKQATPLIAYEASRFLNRSVTIGALTPNLSVQKLWTMFRAWETLGTLPVEATDIAVGNRPEEIGLAGGSPTLVSARRATAYVSIPALLGSDRMGAVRRIVVEGAEGVLVREPNGKLNVMRLVPPPKPDRKPGPPFRTVVEVVTARVRFRDYASQYSKRKPTDPPQVNLLDVPRAIADLSGTRTIRFEGEARGASGTVTARRLGGLARVTGSARRGTPGEYRQGPDADAPRVLVRLQATDAEAPYWYYYFLDPLDAFRVTRGRVDATVGLVLAAAPPGTPANAPVQPAITLSGRFRDAEATTGFLREPLTDASGSLDFVDGALRFDAGGRLMGDRLTANGALWNLTNAAKGATPSPGKPTPEFVANLNVPRLQVTRAVQTALPRNQRLPNGLSLGGFASVSATITGRIGGTDPADSIVATGRVSGVDVGYRDFPTVRGLNADVTFSGGRLDVTNVRGTLAGGGSVAGRAAVRVRGPKGEAGNVVFAATAKDIDFGNIRTLDALTRNTKKEFRLAGRGDAAAVGRVIGGKVTATANVNTRGLRLGDITFPVARARVLMNDNRVMIPSARLESAVGIANIGGDVDPKGILNLSFAVHALDLEPIGNVLGMEGMRGIVSGIGQVSGTVKQPRVVLDRISALNLRARIPTEDKKAFRRFAVDTVTGGGIIWSGDSVELTRELEIRRFPAAVRVSGRVAGLTPAPATGRIRPRLNLVASISNLDYDEVMDQISPMTADQLEQRIAQFRTDATAPRQPFDPGQTPPPNFSGAIQNASIRVLGTADDPQIQAYANLGNLVIGRYPLYGGYVALEYNKTQTRVTELRLDGTVGNITGTGTLTASGRIYGKYRASRLDLGQLAFLTDGAVPLSGNVALSGTLSGTLKEPEVTARLEESQDAVQPPRRLMVGNIQLTDFLLRDLRFTYLGGTRRGILQLPELSFKQGDSTFSFTDARYDLATGEIEVKGDIVVADIQALVQTLRQSGLSFGREAVAVVQRAAGEVPNAAPVAEPALDPLTSVLARLPDPLSGRIALNNIVARGRIADGKFQDPRVSATVNASNLLIETFTADSLSAEARLEGRAVRVERLVATRPGATIRGRGTYDPEGQIDASLESNGFDLESLRTIRGLESFPLRGVVDVYVSATGNSQRPTINASLVGNDLLLVTRPSRLPSATVPETPGTGGASSATPAGTASASLASAIDGARTAMGVETSARNEGGIRLNLVRISAGIQETDERNGRYQIVVPEILVTRGQASLVADAKLPFAFDPNDPTLATQPIEAHIRLGKITPSIDPQAGSGVEPLNLSEFTQFLRPVAEAPQAPTTGTQVDARRQDTENDRRADLDGTMLADIAIAGTLQQPDLDGRVEFTDVRAHLGRDPITGKDRINPIHDFDAVLRLSEDKINFEKFTLALGELNRNRPAGTMEVTGDILLSNLSDLQNLLRQPPRGQRRGIARQGETVELGVEYRLNVALNKLTPQIDNLLGTGEAFQTVVEGGLSITGDKLLTPNIASEGPIQLSKTEVRLPSSGEASQGNTDPITFNPNFNMLLRIKDKASMSNVFARFEAVGDIQVNGPLFTTKVGPARTTPVELAEEARTGRQLNRTETYRVLGIQAIGDLETRGGQIIFPTVRFDVQREGKISVRFGEGITNPGIVLTDVEARGRINSGRAISQLRGAGGFGTGAGGLGLDENTTYTVTITLNGPLIGVLVPDAASMASANDRGRALEMTFSSDPFLSPQAIQSLIFAGPQLALVQQGRFESALGSLAAQALTSGVLTGALSGFTNNLASSLALDSLALDYNADASFGLRLSKRLPDPFENFLIEYSRSFRNRTDPNTLQPFTFRFSYELFDIGIRRYRPRIRIGVSQDEQRLTTYYLQGTTRF